MKKCTEYTLGKTIVSSVIDEYADESDYGSFGNKYEPGCIVRADNSFYEDHINDDEYEPGIMRHEYSFYYPPDNGEDIGTADYKKYAKEDYKRMTDYNNNQWSYLVLKVETSIHSDMGLSHVFAIIGNIESDYGRDGLNEHISELKAQIRYQLCKMGFSDDEINQSVDNSELKKGECYL
jgi:hypothetical protein